MSTKELSIDGFNSQSISGFATREEENFILFELAETKQIEKIIIRARGASGLKTFFNNMTIEIGLTATSLALFDSYFESTEAKPQTVHTFQPSSGPMTGKFIKITVAMTFMALGEVVIIGQ